MNTFELLVVISLFFILAFTPIEHWLRKKFSIKKKKGFFYQPINQIQRIGEYVLLAVFIIILFAISPTAAILFYFDILYFFRALIAWIYEREKKEYILHIANVIGFSLFISVLLFAKVLTF